MTTPDNTHLSELGPAPDPGTWEEGFAVNCKSGPELGHHHADEKVRQFLKASRSANTRRAYQSDLADFLARGGTFPAEPGTIARYLAQRAEELAPATLTRRLVAIAQAHTNRGLPNPCKDDIVRLTLRGIRRVYGQAQRQARPLMKVHLEAIARSGESVPRDQRDKALLTIGFFGAFRRSELVGLEMNFLHWRAEGVELTIAKSKTDQERRGRQIFIPKTFTPICPITALRDWLDASGIASGPVFRRVAHRGTIGDGALSPGAVNVVLRGRLERAGFKADGFSGHSLRAGFVTEAINAGWPLWKIREQTGHASDATLQRYIRREQIKRELFVSI